MSNGLKADLLTAFNGGEVTPELAGRVDKEELRFGTRYVSNFLPLPQGGLKKWYGTTKIGSIPINVVNGYRLIPFDGADEPIALLFCGGNVYAVSANEVYQQGFNVLQNQIIGASYLQINDLIYFTNENTGMFQIQYRGIVGGHHTFVLLSQDVREEPFFPLSWKGNYTGRLTTTGYYGTITVQAVSGDTEFCIQLPQRLRVIGPGVNVLSGDATNQCLSGGNSNERYNTTVGQTKLKLIRIRNGVESVVYSADVGNVEEVQEIP